MLIDSEKFSAILSKKQAKLAGMMAANDLC